jgi:hypothetical protein
MARKTKTELLTAPIPSDELVTVPRAALQALAEWAYPVFAWGRIWSKIPAKNPRASIHDDLHSQLEQERMGFLKSIFWQAQQEAIRREIAMDPTRGYGGSPSLELFMECVAEMDNHHFDEPLTPKEMTERKKTIKAKKAERARLKNQLEHPTSEGTLKTMSFSGDIALHILKENLASGDPKIQAKAQEEIPRLMAELGKLKHTA